MSIATDLAALSGHELICYYVMQCRGSGISLPYKDYGIIDRWVMLAGPDIDALLLILSEVLPPYLAKRVGRVPPSLSGLDKRVMRRLGELKRR